MTDDVLESQQGRSGRLVDAMMGVRVGPGIERLQQGASDLAEESTCEEVALAGHLAGLFRRDSA